VSGKDRERDRRISGRIPVLKSQLRVLPRERISTPDLCSARRIVEGSQPADVSSILYPVLVANGESGIFQYHEEFVPKALTFSSI
jgi:hypothetical protein